MTIDNTNYVDRGKRDPFIQNLQLDKPKLLRQKKGTDVMWNDWPIDPNNSFANAKERTSTGCSMVNRLQTSSSTSPAMPLPSVNCNFILVSAFYKQSGSNIKWKNKDEMKKQGQKRTFRDIPRKRQTKEMENDFMMYFEMNNFVNWWETWRERERDAIE